MCDCSSLLFKMWYCAFSENYFFTTGFSYTMKTSATWVIKFLCCWISKLHMWWDILHVLMDWRWTDLTIKIWMQLWRRSPVHFLLKLLTGGWSWNISTSQVQHYSDPPCCDFLFKVQLSWMGIKRFNRATPADFQPKWSFRGKTCCDIKKMLTIC